MANNPNVNKVVYGNQTVMDITDTTAQAADVASGEVFYTASGARTVGTGSFDSAVWGNITGDIDDQTDLQGELAKKVITLTKAQYDALSTAEKNDPKKVYFITDYEATGTYSEIDDTATAIDKLWSSSKISSELNSTTRIDDTTTAQNKTWSSTKISTEIDGKLSYSVNDATDTDIADADFIPYYDYSASTRKKSTWANIVAKIKAFLGSAAYKDVPTSGNASTAQVVMGNDTRLTDSRPASDVYSWAKASTKPAYSYSEITGTPTLATVATSGDYDDLTGKPDLNDYAPLASPAFTGTPTAPTAYTSTATSQIATTSFVHNVAASKYDYNDPYTSTLSDDDTHIPILNISGQIATKRTKLGNIRPIFILRTGLTATAGTTIRIPASGTNEFISYGCNVEPVCDSQSGKGIKYDQIACHDYENQAGYVEIRLAENITNRTIGIKVIGR